MLLNISMLMIIAANVSKLTVVCFDTAQHGIEDLFLFFRGESNGNIYRLIDGIFDTSKNDIINNC